MKSVLHKCMNCRKVLGHPYKAGDVSPLPYGRLENSIPFPIVGIYFNGALIIKLFDGSITKVYTCFSRARVLDLCTKKLLRT